MRNLSGSYDDLKEKYKEGYRCIYTEKDDNDTMTMHLKNFREEKIHTLQAKGDMEIGQIEDFLDKLKQIEKKNGYDC